MKKKCFSSTLDTMMKFCYWIVCSLQMQQSCKYEHEQISSWINISARSCIKWIFFVRRKSFNFIPKTWKFNLKKFSPRNFSSTITLCAKSSTQIVWRILWKSFCIIYIHILNWTCVNFHSPTYHNNLICKPSLYKILRT